MTELRNVEADLSRFARGVLVASMRWCWWLCLLLGAWCTCRWCAMTIWKAQAESNRTAIVPIVPNRGLILDRNGIVLATNYSAYTLEITPSKVARSLDPPSTTWPR
jgi:penicillin-binding protein 2